MEYRQLVATCTYPNLTGINAHHRACVLFSLQQHTTNGDGGWIQNRVQINAHHKTCVLFGSQQHTTVVSLTQINEMVHFGF